MLAESRPEGNSTHVKVQLILVLVYFSGEDHTVVITVVMGNLKVSKLIRLEVQVITLESSIVGRLLDNLTKRGVVSVDVRQRTEPDFIGNGGIVLQETGERDEVLMRSVKGNY